MSAPVDVLADDRLSSLLRDHGVKLVDCPSDAIARQRTQKESHRLFPPAPRKPRKHIKQSDVDLAVNKKLDELDREFRRLAVEFPKLKQAYETARVVVQNSRGKS